MSDFQERLSTMAHLAQTLLDLARETQMMMANGTRTLNGPCVHPPDYREALATMGKGPQRFLCKVCSDIVMVEG